MTFCILLICNNIDFFLSPSLPSLAMPGVTVTTIGQFHGATHSTGGSDPACTRSARRSVHPQVLSM